MAQEEFDEKLFTLIGMVSTIENLSNLVDREFLRARAQEIRAQLSAAYAEKSAQVPA